jgi:hypothetical protein
MCPPFGALRVTSRCTGADAPAYNVSPLRDSKRIAALRLAEKQPDADSYLCPSVQSVDAASGFSIDFIISGLILCPSINARAGEVNPTKC